MPGPVLKLLFLIFLNLIKYGSARFSHRWLCKLKLRKKEKLQYVTKRWLLFLEILERGSYVRGYIKVFPFKNLIPSHSTQLWSIFFQVASNSFSGSSPTSLFSLNIYSSVSISKCGSNLLLTIKKECYFLKRNSDGWERGENWCGKYWILFGNWRKHAKINNFCVVTSSLSS